MMKRREIWSIKAAARNGAAFGTFMTMMEIMNAPATAYDGDAPMASIALFLPALAGPVLSGLIWFVVVAMIRNAIRCGRPWRTKP